MLRRVETGVQNFTDFDENKALITGFLYKPVKIQNRADMLSRVCSRYAYWRFIKR